MMKEPRLKDTIYDFPLERIGPFEFTSEVARVFDDMAGRSIPWYRQVQEMSASLSASFFQEGSTLYDLGCSTATGTILAAEALAAAGFSRPRLVGVDNSAAMCEKAEEKLAKFFGDGGPVSIRNEDLLETEIRDASVVIMNYTLQFIPPMKREPLLGKIYDNLRHNGILIVSDKTTQSHTDLSRIFVDKYYDFKRANGYSELEISQKREALENVLIPYSVREEESLFLNTGFASVDRFFSWYNFSSFLCIKR
jgi:tRNA (cmo5U34)-methyltransferase